MVGGGNGGGGGNPPGIAGGAGALLSFVSAMQLYLLEKIS